MKVWPVVPFDTRTYFKYDAKSYAIFVQAYVDISKYIYMILSSKFVFIYFFSIFFVNMQIW